MYVIKISVSMKSRENAAGPDSHCFFLNQAQLWKWTRLYDLFTMVKLDCSDIVCFMVTAEKIWRNVKKGDVHLMTNVWINMDIGSDIAILKQFIWSKSNQPQSKHQKQNSCTHPTVSSPESYTELTKTIYRRSSFYNILWLKLNIDWNCTAI